MQKKDSYIYFSFWFFHSNNMVYYKVTYLLIFKQIKTFLKIFIYFHLKGRRMDRRQWDHSPNAYNSLGWARQNQEPSIQSRSPMSVRDPITEVSCGLQVCICRKLELLAELELEPRHAKMIDRHPKECSPQQLKILKD